MSAARPVKGLFLLLLVAVLAAGISPACRPEAGRTSSGSTTNGNSTSGFAVGGVPLSPEAAIGFYMERVFKDYSVPEPRIYTEQVWHTETGDYRIECSAIQKQLSDGTLVPCDPGEVDSYRRLLTQGLGWFAVNERGFRIRDPGAFLQNYNYTVLNDHFLYLRRDAVVMRITSPYQDRPNYTVWFDRATGLVLKYVEDTLAVDPLYVMEVTHLDLNPDFTGIRFYNKDFDIERFPMGPSQLGQLGFQVFAPAYVPAGFVPQEPEKMVVDGLPRLRFAYSDGIQEIVLSELSYSALVKKADVHGQGAVPPSSTTVPSPLTWVVLGNEYRAGLRATHFTLGDTRIVIRSEMDEMETAALIESLFPLE